MRVPTQEAAVPGGDPAVTPHAGAVRFPLFDGLRALAVVAVLVFHAGQVADAESGRRADTWWELLVARLPVGVTVFFLISGFLLYRPFVAARLAGRRPPGLREYARRRVLRIVPAFWLALLVLVPLGLAWLPGGMWPGGVLVFGFLQSWSEPHFTAGLGVSWSLSVEAAFYVLLPLYALLAARWLRGRAADRAARLELAALTGLGLAGLAFSGVAHAAGARALAQALPGTFLWFALGMGLAVVSAAGWTSGPAAWRRLSAAPEAAWGFALAAFLAAALLAGLPGLGEGFPTAHTTREWLVEQVLYGLVAFFLLLPAVFGGERAGLPRRVLAAPALMWIGLVSYGAYLWHTPIIGLLRDHGPSLAGSPSAAAFALVLGVALPATLAVAALSFYVVERPALRLKGSVAARAAVRRFTVSGGREAPRRARALVTEAYATALPADRLDALRLLVDEIVTNSVLHGAVGDDGRIELAVAVAGERIRVDLGDTGRQGEPQLRSPDTRRGDGFGLFLVNQLASSWGAVHEPRLRVWFELAPAVR